MRTFHQDTYLSYYLSDLSHELLLTLNSTMDGIGEPARPPVGLINLKLVSRNDICLGSSDDQLLEDAPLHPNARNHGCGYADRNSLILTEKP